MGLFFCFLEFASNLGSYQLVYISTSLGQIQAQPPSQVAGMTTQAHLRGELLTWAILHPRGYLAMSGDIVACHNSGKEGKVILVSSK